MLSIQAFVPEQLDTLGQAVKDDILYYDPVEGIYGVQGKSLKCGIKGYFDDSPSMPTAYQAIKGGAFGVKEQLPAKYHST